MYLALSVAPYVQSKPSVPIQQVHRMQNPSETWHAKRSLASCAGLDLALATRGLTLAYPWHLPREAWNPHDRGHRGHRDNREIRENRVNRGCAAPPEPVYDPVFDPVSYPDIRGACGFP